MARTAKLSNLANSDELSCRKEMGEEEAVRGGLG